MTRAIYGFRGASLANLLSFKENYPQAGVVALTQNYRCTQPILDAAYRLIRHNDPLRLEVSLQIDKKLQAMGTAAGELSLKPFNEQGAELASIAAEIVAAVQTGAAMKDHAVLVRSHSLGQAVVDALSKAGIATRYPGERGLYREPEVRRALALVRALAIPTTTTWPSTTCCPIKTRPGACWSCSTCWASAATGTWLYGGPWASAEMLDASGFTPPEQLALGEALLAPPARPGRPSPAPRRGRGPLHLSAAERHFGPLAGPRR